MVRAPWVDHCACCVKPQPQQETANAELNQYRKQQTEATKQQLGAQNPRLAEAWHGHNFGIGNDLACCTDCGYNRIAQAWRPCGVMRQ